MTKTAFRCLCLENRASPASLNNSSTMLASSKRVRKQALTDKQLMDRMAAEDQTCPKLKVDGQPVKNTMPDDTARAARLLEEMKAKRAAKLLTAWEGLLATLPLQHDVSADSLVLWHHPCQPE